MAQNYDSQQFDFNSVKKATVDNAAKAEKVVETVINRIPEPIKEQIKDVGQKRVSDALKKADDVVNSPEVKIVGMIAGEPTAGVIKKA